MLESNLHRLASNLLPRYLAKFECLTVGYNFTANLFNSKVLQNHSRMTSYTGVIKLLINYKISKL